MQKLFDEVNTLDQRCYNKFGLTEDILMEHAANAIADFIHSNFQKGTKVLVVCGSGNNGADGLALARILHQDYNVKIFCVKQAKTQMAKIQMRRALAVGGEFIQELEESDILVDAFLGTGCNNQFLLKTTSLMQDINALNSYKIACDIPSGIMQDGKCDPNTFQADTTLSMGALKKSMYSDSAKEFLGNVQVVNLGISRQIYETSSNWNLLDISDLKLPFRNKKNTHKGTYGHLAVLSGEKTGASVMSGLSALKFGVGLVTLVSKKEPINPHYSLMYSEQRPENATALALGMGLGTDYDERSLNAFLDNKLPLIADADIFYMPHILTLLQRENVILTPHPKEFVSLLKITKLASITVEELQVNRFKYADIFSKAFPNITLLLKGANVIITQNTKFFINPHGTPALAKGGSGDILSGLIGSLLAQGNSCLHSTLHASLAHTKLTQDYKGADFSLTPSDLIQAIGDL